MKADKAVLMYCPFKTGRCMAEKCMAWVKIYPKTGEEGNCDLLRLWLDIKESSIPSSSTS